MVRRVEAPLYDPRHEHDACGIGFVADAGGRSADRILPMALAGLAALGHRGAFGADGQSSDGAGVALPLDSAIVERLVPGAGAGRPGVLQLFLPRPRGRASRARELVLRQIADAGLDLIRWRDVPVDPGALGNEAACSRPAFAQAIIARPAGEDDQRFERRLVVLRRRLEAAAREVGEADLAIPSASGRTLVYKGLVRGASLARLFPDLDAGLPVRYALFHQRYATNTRPAWRLAQPFRAIAHNGEINTVRGNREQVRGRSLDAPRSRGPLGEVAAALIHAGPLLTPDGSDSLSLDEALELLTTTGWDLATALLATVPEALPVRGAHHPAVASLQRRTAGFLAPWDGPAAIVFADGRRVGALLDRNGLRPVAYAVTRDRIVAVASEAGAVPVSAAETVRRGRLGPGQMLLVDPARRVVLEDADAKAHVLARLPIHDAPHPAYDDRPPSSAPRSTSPADRFLAGVDAERARLDIRTMALEAHEPLWSMGDDTPTPGRSHVDRRVADHLRQAFAQVTNPPIDPERERVVMDLRVELGPRQGLLAGLPRRSATLRLDRPIVADLDGLEVALRAKHGRAPLRLDATWPTSDGAGGFEAALGRLALNALRGARGGARVAILSDRALGGRRANGPDRLPMPSVLAAGAVHAALTTAGLRGRMDLLVEAADVLDVHSLAMTLAAGATAVHPWLSIELAAELAGTRGAETLTVEAAVANLLGALEAGLRKTLARMGISAAASYVGGAMFDVLELHPDVVARCFPAAAAWPGMLTFADLAERSLRRWRAALELPEPAPGREGRLPDPGFARFRADGERHLYAPRIIGAVQAMASARALPTTADDLLATYRIALAREAAVVRDDLRLRRRRPIPLSDVEAARSIVRRFVVSAMSVGALSPEVHQTLTMGMQRAGGAANTGEGGEDPAWYVPGPGGERHDARIKQVASARFGVTAQYLARADQIEIKIAQGSKPGEGGQLPAKKATAYIASLRRGQPNMSYISPPPHHDIYSIEDLAQLIADLRAINPAARIGVKLVASRGVGTIAAGVAKAGASYIHLSGHSGGTGASPLSSIKHVGAPWELGLAEAHQVLMLNGLRDRVVLRTDGGLQTGRDLLIAALLGAEEFAFGTAALVAVGCDMARQCHLDTCPTGIATQREDLRAKFTGTPEHVERFALNLAEDLRRELAAFGARSIGDAVGESRRLAPAPGPMTHDLRPLLGAGAWAAGPARRADPAMAGSSVVHVPASELESDLVRMLRSRGAFSASGLAITTADRSFGAAIAGSIERAEVRAPVRLELRGAAGQSFGAFATDGMHLGLVGQANDYVAKGLSGGTVVVAPEPELGTSASGAAIAGNACLYGATGGRLHLIGQAGMRFGVRNSGAEGVVEGVGPHGCEYMTGGIVVVLGPIGANFGAGMTGGRAYVHDPSGRHAAALHGASVGSRRLAAVMAERVDGAERLAEWRRLVEAHRDAGSATAAMILASVSEADDVWLVEPLALAAHAGLGADTPTGGNRAPAPAPDHNSGAPMPIATAGSGAHTVGP